MKKFKTLEHKADLKIRAFGDSKAELFLNILGGMTEFLKPETENQKIKNQKIKIKSVDLETLLVDFLNEILYQNQTDKTAYNRVIFRKFTDFEIEADLSGKKTERFGEDIKAATYHNLDIRQKKDGKWEATVLFDV